MELAGIEATRDPSSLRRVGIEPTLIESLGETMTSSAQKYATGTMYENIKYIYSIINARSA